MVAKRLETKCHHSDSLSCSSPLETQYSVSAISHVSVVRRCVSRPPVRDLSRPKHFPALSLDAPDKASSFLNEEVASSNHGNRAKLLFSSLYRVGRRSVPAPCITS